MSERSLIEWIRETYPVPSGTVPGDDCSVTYLPNELKLLATVDTCIDGRHAMVEECGPRAFGRKALARAASDFAAMGVAPAWALVSGTASPSTTEEAMQEIQHGLQSAASECGVAIVGGDISSHDGPLHLAVTVFGLTHETPVLRSGARPGDLVAVTGPLGGALSGRHLTFPSRIPVGIWLRIRMQATAMIDITDGLSTDALHLAEESAVGLELVAADIPIAEGTIENALNDGEDYELLFTFPPETHDLLAESPAPLHVIGVVTEGSGVQLIEPGGGKRALTSAGWEHPLGGSA
jgi:thiamine-monophosphate kinase